MKGLPSTNAGFWQPTDTLRNQSESDMLHGKLESQQSGLQKEHRSCKQVSLLQLTLPEALEHCADLAANTKMCFMLTGRPSIELLSRSLSGKPPNGRTSHLACILSIQGWFAQTSGPAHPPKATLNYCWEGRCCTKGAIHVISGHRQLRLWLRAASSDANTGALWLKSS